MPHPTAARGRRSTPAGFTLVELLVVIGIIALLIGILLPSLATARKTAVTVKCLAQMRQLGNAVQMYVDDNHGWLPSSDTCGPLYPANFTTAGGSQVFTTVSATQTWVGWVDGGPTAQAMQNGTFWKYLRTAAIYKCPADPNDLRTRSYSMNQFLCTGDGSWQTNRMFDVYKITEVRRPAETIAFTEEPDPRASNSGAGVAGQWNENGWYQLPYVADSMSGLPDGSAPGLWGDVIANWHRDGCNFTYVDGHAENFRFSDKRTTNYLNADPGWPSTKYVTANNRDLDHVRKGIASWPVQRAN